MKVKCIFDGYLTSKVSGLINDKKPDVKLGEIYPVVQVIKDKKENEHYDIGLKSNLSYVTSIDTGEELKDGHKIHWVHPSRFEIVEE